MLNKKIKLLFAVVVMLGGMSVASASHYYYNNMHYYDTCCCQPDPYSKFATCNNRCGDYPQQLFPNPSP